MYNESLAKIWRGRRGGEKRGDLEDWCVRGKEGKLEKVGEGSKM